MNVALNDMVAGLYLQHAWLGYLASRHGVESERAERRVNYHMVHPCVYSCLVRSRPGEKQKPSDL